MSRGDIHPPANRPAQQRSGMQNVISLPQIPPAKTTLSEGALSTRISTTPKSKKSDIRESDSPTDNGGPSRVHELPANREPRGDSVKRHKGPNSDSPRHEISRGKPGALTQEAGLRTAQQGSDGIHQTRPFSAMAATTNLHLTDAYDCDQASDVPDDFNIAGIGDGVFSSFPDGGSLLAGMGSQF
ncbi:hypothetical protein K431DRAFT_280572 [Polychaeton citri CBS 116435]|uniref:Uncharacterized protein n=1 Tax=Polychaeton citri CBS 116435 TaxID=1314669 RepID=A0A9P4URP1_9PEZI|nr:hypothetical protein K431DRAFT_280572 [Polychaeton citri CBS 116435]